MIQQFNTRLIDLKEKTKNSTNQSTRGQKVIPKLIYHPSGKWIIIRNHQALSKYTGRSSKFISKFFSQKLGMPSEITDSEIKFKAGVKLNRFKEIENLFYKEEILCFNCNSPDTLRNQQQSTVTCSSCNSVN